MEDGEEEAGRLRLRYVWRQGNFPNKNLREKEDKNEWSGEKESEWIHYFTSHNSLSLGCSRFP